MSYQALPTDRQPQKAIARIKRYRGNSGFAGIHEYEVKCGSCSHSNDLNYSYPNPVQHDITCGHCGEEVRVSFIRSNLSARFYNA